MKININEKQNIMAFELPELGYAYDALEPHIDARTMEIHYSKHHNGYTNNLNNAVAGTDLEGTSIEDILANLDMNNGAVRNNGGGFYNHSLFWSVMNPVGQRIFIRSTKGRDRRLLLVRLMLSKKHFAKAAATRFGSGWAWLCVHEGGRVEICSTPNQDNRINAWSRLWWYTNFRNRCLGTCILP